MIELAIIFSLSAPAFLLAYTAFQLKDRHSVMKMFLSLGSMVFMLGIPFTGWKLADNQNVAGVQDYLIYFELAGIMIFVIFLFYTIWLYLTATGKVTSGTETEFDNNDL